MLSKKEGSMSKIKLINQLMFAFIIIAIIFGILYYNKLNPIAKVTASTTKPSFFFAFYGEGEGKMQKPMSVLIEEQNIYVADSELNKILVFDKEGKYKFSIGRPGAGKGQLNFPYGLAIDSKNQLYVADMKNHRVQVFDAKGKFEKYFPNDTDLFSSPSGLYIKNSKIYVVDILLNKVFVFDLKSGEKLLEFGGAGVERGKFKYPNGITVDSNGVIYVADTGNDRIQVFNQHGQVINVFEGYNAPRGIKLMDNKYLYVVNNSGDAVVVSSLKGEKYNTFGDEEDDQLNFPIGIDIIEKRIYITDSQNHGIKVYHLQ